MRSILCYLLFAIGGTVTYVCAEEKEQIGSDTLENILFVDDFEKVWYDWFRRIEFFDCAFCN